MRTAFPLRPSQRLWTLPSLPSSTNTKHFNVFPSPYRSTPTSLTTTTTTTAFSPSFATNITPTPPHTTTTSHDLMDTTIEETVERIHSTPFKLVVYVTGGAAQAPSWLLSVPGASRTILECRVPYSNTALAEVLGYTPETSVSTSTAEAMARAAYRQAAALSSFGTPIIGASATCALSTDRDRRGQHRAVVSIHTGATTRTYTLMFAKGVRGRLGEDTLASRLVLDAVAAAMGAAEVTVETKFAAEGLLGPGDSLEATPLVPTPDRAHLIRDMLNGKYKTLEFSGSGGMAVVDAPRPRRVYLPGSFNPLHQGHVELLNAGCKIHGMSAASDGAFELSVGNADKGLLPLPEIERRVAQFVAAQLPVVITQAPLFTQKSDLFPKSSFVVGYDTAARLVQERYYGSETATLLQFAKLAHQGCGFLVAGRKDAESGRFKELSDLEMPEVLQRGTLFRGIPQSEFRMDISSTELREGGAHSTGGTNK